MAKRKTAVPFQGTAEQETQLKELIASHKDMQGALMPVLQQAQEIYGYLPIEVQTIIAEGLDIPLEEVYGVATFYGQFNLNPKGKYQIAVCLGTACYVRGRRRRPRTHRAEARCGARRHHSRRCFFAGCHAMPRRLRPCPCHDHQRRSLRTSCPRGCGQDSGSIFKRLILG